MLDGEEIAEFRARINDRYTAAEIADILGLSADDMSDAFIEIMVENVELVAECWGCGDEDDELP